MLLVPCSILLFLSSIPSEASQDSLPQAWMGTWQGTMQLHGPSGKPGQVEVTLTIEPIAASGEWTWKTSYGKKGEALIKDYKLVPVSGKPGLFKMDEKNGILLDARLTDNILHSQFKVGDSFLTARYEMQGDILTMEVTSAPCPDQADKKEQVQSFQVTSVQVARLKKIAK